jgi:hypothetical protein
MIEMAKDSEPALRLTLEQFVAVLGRWDAYMRIEFSQMAREFPVISCNDEDLIMYGGRESPGYAATGRVNLSNLAPLIWRTLEAGAAEVDRIHDEVFVKIQVEHFKEIYSSPAYVASQMRDKDGNRYKLAPPTDLFFKLGKPAQITIAREGFLEEAIKRYKQAEEIVNNKEEGEKIEQSQRRERKKEMKETRKRVRELDGLQCVFCGAQVKSNFRYVQITPGTYQPDNVVFSCSPCQPKINHNIPEAVEMKPIYGRFAKPESLAHG